MLIWQKYLFLIKTNGLALNVKKIEFMVQVGTWQKLKHCDPIELFLDDVRIYGSGWHMAKTKAL